MTLQLLYALPLGIKRGKEKMPGLSPSQNGGLHLGFCPPTWTPGCTLSHEEGTKDSPFLQ